MPSAVISRPRSASEIVDGSIHLVRRNFASLFVLSAVFFLPFALVGFIGSGVAGRTLHLAGSGPLAVVKSAGWFLLVTLWFHLTVAAALTRSVFELRAGRPAAIGAVFSWTRRRILSALGVVALIGGVLSVVAVGISAAIIRATWYLQPRYLFLTDQQLFLSTVPLVAGAILILLLVAATLLVPAFAIAILEPSSPVAAIGRAFRLTVRLRLHTARVILLVIVVFFLPYLATMGLLAATKHPSLEPLVAASFFLIGHPFLEGVVVLLYEDLRVRKEGSDLEALSRAIEISATTAGQQGAQPMAEYTGVPATLTRSASVGKIPAPSVKRSTPPRPFVAGLLTLVAPGLGHLYAGAPLRAIAICILALAAPVPLVALFGRVPGLAILTLVVAAGITITVLIVRDATRIARASAAAAARRAWVSRWPTVIALGLLYCFALQPAYLGLLKRSIAEAYRIPTNSMAPGLVAGDYIMTVPVGPSAVTRGARLAFHSWDGVILIKRVVGLPGDTIAMRNGALEINGHVVSEPYLYGTRDGHGTGPDRYDSLFSWQQQYILGRIGGDEKLLRPTLHTWGPLVVPGDSVFVLGDNRDNSLDSRYRGFVARTAFFRRPTSVYFSFDTDSARIRWSRIGIRLE